MSVNGRLISSPRTAGTMQNAQLLSQPIWMVTQALYDDVRLAGSADGNIAPETNSSSMTAASRISVIGPCSWDSRTSSAARWTLCVPSTTSTYPARARTPSRSFWARQPEKVAEVAVELVVGVLPDAAGVEHDHVGVVEPVGGLHAVGLEQPGEPLRVVLVHLAPVGAHDVAAGRLGHPFEAIGGLPLTDGHVHIRADRYVPISAHGLPHRPRALTVTAGCGPPRGRETQAATASTGGTRHPSTHRCRTCRRWCARPS